MFILKLQMQLTSDPRRADRERRFKPPPATSAPAEDLTTDYMNILGKIVSGFVFLFPFKSTSLQVLVVKFKLNFMPVGMVFSMCGLMMRLKWCAWTAVFCSSISFANSRVSDDTKQVCTFASDTDGDCNYMYEL